VIDHLECRLAHAQQAHLAQIVEAVFVDDGDPRPMPRERDPPLVHRPGQHRVEQGDAVPPLAQTAGRVERAERRVRLPRLQQLRIESQVVGLAEQQVSHGPPAV
jgi:hypothetical protein